MAALSPAETLLAFLQASNANFHDVIDRPEYRELVLSHEGGLFILDYDEASTALSVDVDGTITVNS